jgi:hypothetical protein
MQTNITRLRPSEKAFTLVDRMFCKLSKNCDRCFFEHIAVSNFPMLGMSNHSERNSTIHA